jgi:hypothetical protein
MEACSLTRFGHTGRSVPEVRSWRLVVPLTSHRRLTLGRRRFFPDVVKLEAAERTPVQIPADPLLQVTQRVLVHRVDVIDPAQLLHTKATAAGAPAGSPEQEQKPLVPRLPAAAFFALEDGMIAELIEEASGYAHQSASATRTLPHVCSLYRILPRHGNSRENKVALSRKVNHNAEPDQRAWRATAQSQEY